jgi:ABC-type uncharacterized transport system involved in gliding motility auxiliary subunit
MRIVTLVKTGRILGIAGIVSLISIPLTLFIWNWYFTWVVFFKLAFGVFAVAIWFWTNLSGIKQSLRGQHTFFRGFNILFGLMALAAVIMINAICLYFPVYKDLTNRQIFSLSDQTKSTLNNLTDKVRLQAFYSAQDKEYNILSDYFQRYRSISDNFEYEFFDPIVHQELVESYKIHKGGPRIIVTSQNREERVKINNLTEVEQVITTALYKAAFEGEKKKLCLLYGHAEKSLNGNDPRLTISHWAKDLAAEGYLSDTISLLEQNSVPQACQLLIVTGPKSDLTQDELSNIDSYLQNGGRLLVFLGSGDSSSLSPLLQNYGIEIGDNTVVYPKSNRPFEVVTDPLRYPNQHPIFAKFFKAGTIVLNQLQAVFPLARSVTKTAQTPSAWTTTELAYTPETTWAETGKIEPDTNLVFDRDQDIPGPISIAATTENKHSGSRIAVLGSSLMVTDSAYRIFPFNRNLTMNTIAWLVQEDNRISIRPRFRAASLLQLNHFQMVVVSFLAMDVLPLLILTIGLAIWQLRKWS